MSVTIKFNQGTFKALGEVSDKVTYAVARETLDKVGSLQATAHKSGKMEQTMYSRGVQEDSEGYYIGNFTTYAQRVYDMNRANWTNPYTRPHWFKNVWQEYGDLIKESCIKRYGIG